MARKLAWAKANRKRENAQDAGVEQEGAAIAADVKENATAPSTAGGGGSAKGGGATQAAHSCPKKKKEKKKKKKKTKQHTAKKGAHFTPAAVRARLSPFLEDSAIEEDELVVVAVIVESMIGPGLDVLRTKLEDSVTNKDDKDVSGNKFWSWTYGFDLNIGDYVTDVGATVDAAAVVSVLVEMGIDPDAKLLLCAENHEEIVIVLDQS